MAPVTHASQIQEDGFDDLCEAFRLYWDEDAFADLCEAFQFFGDEVEQDPIQAPLRALKSIAGAEEAKALFIIVKARFETAKRQGVDLSEEDFSVNIVGNRGKGEFLSSNNGSVLQTRPAPSPLQPTPYF